MNRKLKHIVISSIVLFGPLTIVMEAKATGRLNPSSISKVVAGVKKAATGSINTSQFNQQKILDNLSIPERLQEKAKSLLENGIIKHSNTENIKQQRREQIQINNFYYRELLENGMIRKHVSVEKPLIDLIEGETVTTKFKNPSGVEKKLVTEGIPGWIKGSDIVNTESEKSTLQGPSIKSGVELTEGAKKIVEGLRSGNKPELNPEGGAISKRTIPVKTKEKSQEVKHVETAKPEENQNDKKNITDKIEKLALDESKDLEKEHIYENIDENGKVKNIESTGPIYENLKFKDHTYENVAFVKSPRYNKHGIIDEENEKQEPIYMNVSFKDHTYENIDDIIRTESGENSRTSSISSSENTESSSSSSSSVSSLVDSGRSNTVVMRKNKPILSTRYYSDGYLERKYSEIVYGNKKSKKGSISKYMRKLFKKEDKQDNK